MQCGREGKQLHQREGFSEVAKLELVPCGHRGVLQVEGQCRQSEQGGLALHSGLGATCWSEALKGEVGAGGKAAGGKNLGGEQSFIT